MGKVNRFAFFASAVLLLLGFVGAVVFPACPFYGIGVAVGADVLALLSVR